jgi:hypothetical protein
MSEGFVGLNCLLKIGDGTEGTSTTFTPLAEVKSFNWSGMGLETAEFTHQQSPGFYREYKPTFKKPGEVSATLNYLPSDTTQSASAGLRKVFDDRALQDFAIVWDNDDQETEIFSAYLTNFARNTPLGEPVELQITLQLIGAPTPSTGGTS